MAVTDTPTGAPPSPPDPLDVAAVKKDFPLLDVEVHGKRIVYLDSAATSQKPEVVLDTLDRYYRTTNANVHRGVYAIAEEATNQMERARAKVARFIAAPSVREVVFTRNATEACNLVAYSWGRANLHEGDVVVLTQMEHHANIVPWQMLAAERGVELRWIPLTADGHLDLTDLGALLDGAKLLGVTAMSNVLGTINPVAELVAAAHAAGALVLVDACQHVPHLPTDVQAWDADFVAFSAHKMCGPTGVGILWAREALLDAMPPFLGGGEMIRDVRLDGFTTNDLPWKFEAGTPAIAEAIGFGTAIDYLEGLGMEAVRAHEIELTGYAMRTLHERFGYCFRTPPGSSYPPILQAHTIDASLRPFEVAGDGARTIVTPFLQEHGAISSLGFRIGGFAYSSDVSALDEAAFRALAGVDCWVVDALREAPHPTHSHVEQTLAWIARIRPRHAVLTNMHIDLDYDSLSARLPSGVVAAYDGMRFVAAS